MIFPAFRMSGQRAGAGAVGRGGLLPQGSHSRWVRVRGRAPYCLGLGAMAGGEPRAMLRVSGLERYVGQSKSVLRCL